MTKRSLRKAKWGFIIQEDMLCHEQINNVNGYIFKFGEYYYHMILGAPRPCDEKIMNPHAYCLLGCTKSNTIWKTKAVDIIKTQELFVEKLCTYLLPIDNFEKYKLEMFPHKHGNSSEEQIIKKTIEFIEDTGNTCNHDLLKRKLVEEVGAKFVTKYKRLIENVLEYHLSTDDVIHCKIDPVENIENFQEAITNYKEILRKAFLTGFKTRHKHFIDLDESDVRKYVIIISLMPMLFKRTTMVDNLPGLFFYGKGGTGKSYMFHQLSAYKNIAKDAGGVGRYKLLGYQRGILIDDVDPGFLIAEENQSSLKQLASGAYCEVKTNGNTSIVRAFLVITSNCVPDYFNSKIPGGWNAQDWEANCEAWQRRFITVEFNNAANFPSLKINFECNILKFLAAETIEEAFNGIKNYKLKDMLKIYCDELDRFKKDRQYPVFVEIKEQMFRQQK